MTDNNYDELEVNTRDTRLTGINQEKSIAIHGSNETFDDMITSSEAEFGKQSDAVDTWEKTQTDIQNEQTEFAIDKIEQNQEWARQDYIKEQSGAYTDWQKQSAQHGVNAEQMAAQGMTKTGYSESSLVSMYNTYQNRVATARESFQRADVEYKQMITEARLQNSAALAEIANNALQKKLEISMAAMQYKNTLLLEKAKAKREIQDSYWNRYAQMYGFIQNELKAKRDAKEFDTQMAETKRHNEAQEKIAQDSLQLEQDKFSWQKSQANKTSSGGSSGGGSKTSGGKIKGGSKTKNLPSIKSNPVNQGKPISTEPNRTVDMQSVLDLGFGPISASRLAQLVAEGKVKKYTDGDKIKFSRVQGKNGGRTKDFMRVNK